MLLKIVLHLILWVVVTSVAVSLVQVLLLFLDLDLDPSSGWGVLMTERVYWFILICTLVPLALLSIVRFCRLMAPRERRDQRITDDIESSLRVGLAGGAVAFRSVAILLAFVIGIIAFAETRGDENSEVSLTVVLVGIVPALIVIMDYVYDMKSKVLDPPKAGRAKADDKDDTPDGVRIQRAGVVSMLKWEFIGIGVLLTLMLLGFALLVWLNPIEQMTPAQTTLLELADTLVKVALAGILVLIGLCVCRRRGGGGDN